MKLSSSGCLKLFIFLSLSFAQPLSAEEWAIQEGVTVQRYCRGEEVRYSTTAPKDFQLCFNAENKGSFNKVTAASDIKQKDFSDGGVVAPMTPQERKQMARDLRSIQNRRDQEAPQDMLNELNKIIKSWQSDPNFRKQLIKGLTPEEQKLIKQLPLFSIQMIKGVLGPDLKKSRGFPKTP